MTLSQRELVLFQGDCFARCPLEEKVPDAVAEHWPEEGDSAEDSEGEWEVESSFAEDSLPFLLRVRLIGCGDVRATEDEEVIGSA